MAIQKSNKKITPLEKAKAKKDIDELVERREKARENSEYKLENYTEEELIRMREKFFTPLGDRSTD